MNEQFERLKTTAIISAGIVLLLVIGFLYISSSGPSDGGSAISNARIELHNASTGLRHAEESASTIRQGLDDSAREAQRISESNSDAAAAISRTQSRNESATAILERDRQLIEESREILRAIRTQAK